MACRLLSQVAGISGPDHGNTNAAEAIILRLGGVVFLRQLIRHELSSAAFLPGGCWRGCRGGRSLLVSAGERLLESFEFGA
jgi:hypothetical protein